MDRMNQEDELVKKSKRYVPLIIGLVLCGLFVIALTTLGAVAVCKGVGTVFSSQKPVQTPSEFSLRDINGNILMQGGIESASAEAVTNANGMIDYVVTIHFTDSASEEFAAITTEHIGERIDIYLNDDMLSSPMVQCPITDGTCQITNMMDYQTAEELAEKLRTTID